MNGMLRQPPTNVGLKGPSIACVLGKFFLKLWSALCMIFNYCIYCRSVFVQTRNHLISVGQPRQMPYTFKTHIFSSFFCSWFLCFVQCSILFQVYKGHGLCSLEQQSEWAASHGSANSMFTITHRLQSPVLYPLISFSVGYKSESNNANDSKKEDLSQQLGI